jgi:hypothetical protein
MEVAMSCSVTGLSNPAAASAASTAVINTLSAAAGTVRETINGVPYSAIGAAAGVSFTIADGNRGAGRPSVKVTLAFTTVGAVSTSQSITLNYPSGFFSATPIPTFAAGDASVNTMTGSCTITSTQIVISPATTGIDANTAFTITLSGITMGAATAGVSNGITVATTGDSTASTGISSGAIVGIPTSVTFTIANADRGARRTSVKVTLAFTTFAALPISGKITLNYPSGFFATTATPTFVAGDASVATMTGTCGAPGATSIVITTGTAGIPAATAFTIILSGATLGAQNNGSSTITVQTDTDVVASNGVASGDIRFSPYDVSLTIAAGDRTPGKTGVAAVLSFKTMVPMKIGGLITLTYPAGFFDAVKPSDNGAGSTSVPTMTAISSTPTATTGTQIIITTAVAGIAADTTFTITLSGLKMGAANVGSPTGITVQTNTIWGDLTIASGGAPSGGIGSTVSSFSVAPSSTVIATPSVDLIIKFTTSKDNDIAIGGKITLGFPTGWFDSSVAPAAAVKSSVKDLTATFSPISANSITITTAGAAILKNAAFTITLSGMKTGPAAVAAGTFSLTTSVDLVAAEFAGPALGATSPPPTTTAAPKSPANSAAASVLVLLASAFALLL